MSQLCTQSWNWLFLKIIFSPPALLVPATVKTAEWAHCFWCCYRTSGSERLWGKVGFSHDFLFPFLQQTVPTAHVGNVVPFVWEKEKGEATGKINKAKLRQPQHQSDRLISQNKEETSEHLDHGYARLYTLGTTSTFPSYCYIMSMRHLRMKWQQIPTLTAYKNALCLKTCCTTRQLLLRSWQVSPKATHYWYMCFLLLFRQHTIDTHFFLPAFSAVRSLCSD